MGYVSSGGWILFYRKQLWAIIGCFLLTQFSAGLDINSVIVPVPISEAKDIAAEWLIKSGFEMSPLAVTPDKFTVSVRKKHSFFSFDMMPSSALATQIVWAPSPSEKDILKLISYLKRRSERLAHLSEPMDTRFIPKVIRHHQQAVVCIYAEKNGQTVQLTGFFIDSKGLIMSTAHGLSLDQDVVVLQKSSTRIKGKVIRIDPLLDLTLIDIKRSFDSYISLDKGKEFPETGELLFAIGCPENLPQTVVKGYVNRPRRRSKNVPFIEVNMDILPGSSGSPVFNMDESMVGIIKGRYRGVGNRGFLIPFQTIIKFMTTD